VTENLSQRIEKIYRVFNYGRYVGGYKNDNAERRDREHLEGIPASGKGGGNGFDLETDRNQIMRDEEERGREIGVGKTCSLRQKGPRGSWRGNPRVSRGM